MKFKVIRDVTTDECHWLKEDVKEGSIVYVYDGHTYGCVSSAGIACTMNEGETPFFELPISALKGEKD